MPHFHGHSLSEARGVHGRHATHTVVYDFARMSAQISSARGPFEPKKKDTWRTPPASAHTCWSGVLCGDTVGVGMIGRVLQWPRFDAHEVGVAAKLIMRSGEGKCVCNSVHARDVGKGLWDGASMTKD